MKGVVEEIYITREGGAPMTKVDEVEAVAGGGLKGDRYMEKTGYWSGIDECEVTLIEGEDVDAIQSETDIRIARGEHRRNIITRGIRLKSLVGRRFSVGAAVLEYDRPRPPCHYIETITERGMAGALSRGRGGICARVVKSGTVRTNDPIEILE